MTWKSGLKGLVEFRHSEMKGRTFYNIPGLKNIMSKGLETGKQGKVCSIGRGICLAGALEMYRKSKK